jgi:single-strand DNA-binding protein
MNAHLTQVLRSCQYTFRGRLARDPESKYFENGSSVTTFRIAVNKPGAKRDDGQEPDWFKVEAWRELGEAMADTLKKGDLVEVTGRVRFETWTDRNGEQQTTVCITADRFEAIPTPGAPAAVKPAANPAAAAAYGMATGVAANAAAPGWDTGAADDDEEVPF